MTAVLSRLRSPASSHATTTKRTPKGRSRVCATKVGVFAWLLVTRLV